MLKMGDELKQFFNLEKASPAWGVHRNLILCEVSECRGVGAGIDSLDQRKFLMVIMS